MTKFYLNGTELQENQDVNLGGFVYPYSWLLSSTPEARRSLGIHKSDDVFYDPRYYYAPNMPRALEDISEKDSDGNQIYRKIWDANFNNGAGKEKGAMVDTTEPLITIGLKTTSLLEIRTTTNDLLKPTDFYIIRNHEEGLEIPTEVSTRRAAIIAESQRVQEAIPETTTVEELIEVMASVNWPNEQ